jgi:hypothetical protein
MAPHNASGNPAEEFEAWVIRTRLAQGLPARVEDVAVLARIADLLGNYAPVNDHNERTKKDGSATDAIAVEETVSREPSSQPRSATSSRSPRHQQQRRVVVWGCKEHQTPPGDECQGCADQGELFTRADAADLARRKPYRHRRRPQ